MPPLLFLSSVFLVYFQVFSKLLSHKDSTCVFFRYFSICKYKMAPVCYILSFFFMIFQFYEFLVFLHIVGLQCSFPFFDFVYFLPLPLAGKLGQIFRWDANLSWLPFNASYLQSTAAAIFNVIEYSNFKRRSSCFQFQHTIISCYSLASKQERLQEGKGKAGGDFVTFGSRSKVKLDCRLLHNC